MITEVEKVNLYIASKSRLCDDIFVYPKTGRIVRENEGFTSVFNEYIRENKLYIVIDGVMYNKAKLIYDSVYKDNLPNKRYKVSVVGNDIAHPTIDNISMSDLRYAEPIISSVDENVTILFEDIETEINIEYLLKLLSNKEYKVIKNEED